MKPNNQQTQSSSILGKRKKATEKKSDYLHKWVEAQASYRPELYQTEGIPGHLLPVMAPPLYPIPPQDPNLYRYPLHYQPPPFNNIPPASAPFNPYNYYDFSNNDKDYLKNRRIKTAKHRNNLRHSSRGGIKTDNADNDEAVRVEDEFTSLPVITRREQRMQNVDPEEDNDRRRYSDPGIAQDANTESTDSDNSESEVGSQGNRSIILCLIQQIKLLNENNVRLHKELYETKGELENLKQQMAVWNSDAASRHSSQVGHNMMGGMQNGIHSGSSAIYSPGMLSDLVREIRDAARIREEAMYNKMKMLFEEKTHANKINGNIQYEKNMTDWKNVDQFKGHSRDKNTNDRISKIEDDLQYLKINQSRDDYLPSPSSGVTLTASNAHQQSPSPHQQPALEHERRRLKMELNEEKLARNKAETNVHKLEMLVTQLRSMLSSNNSMASNGGGGVGRSTSPVDPLNMVLGPVTDL